MANVDVKAELHSYLRGAREALVWKLDGLDEYDVRRPMTPSGTNLLGLVKHSTATHVGYFGDVFGRSALPSAPPAPDAGPAAEFWARPEEPRDELLDRYRAAWALADSTLDELPLDAVGQVWWWGDATVTLHHVLVHVIADTQRHAGHADIIRELIDGSVGMLDGADNLHIRDPEEQRRFHQRVEEAAARFR
jgi:uncharacterized damage-inducible protein DinB